MVDLARIRVRVLRCEEGCVKDEGETLDLPEAVVGRVAGYRSALDRLHRDGVATISSSALAEISGVNSAQLRKDLSHFGSYGVRGVGYDVPYLREQLRHHMGDTTHVPVVIVGAGNLGRALANHTGFGGRGFRVQGLFDILPAEPGVRSMVELPGVVTSPAETIGIIATPARAAQEVADLLIDLGIRSLLNFAPTRLVVGPDVAVRKVDLGSELEILAYHRPTAQAPVSGAPRVAEELRVGAGPMEGG